MKIAVIITLLIVAPLSSHAEMFDKDEQHCGQLPNTMAIADCINARTKVWDQHLNAAYTALGKVVDPEQREPLKAAQRAWIQYRDANCKFYESHEGTISSILGTECLRSMTEDRAMELEQAAQP